MCVVATSCFWLSDGSLIVGEDTILRLPLLGHWRNVPLIFSSHFTAFSEGQYRPLSYALLAAGRTLASPANVRFWQACLLGLQAINVLLVYAVARSLLRSHWPAAVSAALFALHPLASIVVHHIDHFRYALGLALCLGSLHCYVRGAHRGGRIWWLASLALFGGGLLTTKAATALPAALVAYELMRGPKWRGALIRLSPFLVLLLPLSYLRWTRSPAPLCFEYVEYPLGTWHMSLVSVVAGLGHYVRGILLGRNIPVVLSEVVVRKQQVTDMSFLAWAVVCTGFLACIVLLVRKERAEPTHDRDQGLAPWGAAAFGLLWMPATLLPFASTGWNLVKDYVAWPYLYFPLAGFALSVGAASVSIARLKRRRLRYIVYSAATCWCVYLGAQQVTQSLAARSDLRYWYRALTLNPASQRASVALGRAHLRRGDVSQAARFLFGPPVTKRERSSLSMADYYVKRGDLLAAAVHLVGLEVEKPGLICQAVEPVRAELLQKAGALDFAEARWGEVLIANPYHTRALCQLAHIWLTKGHGLAALRLIARAREIDPSDETIDRVERVLRSSTSSAAVVALAPSRLLRYVTSGDRDPAVERQIVVAADRHRSDPVILCAAGQHRLAGGDPRGACRLFDRALALMPTSSELWAGRCSALVDLGAYGDASAAAERAMKQADTDAHACFVVGSALLGQSRPQHALICFRAAVRFEPSIPAGHFGYARSLLALGRAAEAIPRLHKAIELMPEATPDSDATKMRAELHACLGATLITCGKNDEGMTCLRQALQLDAQCAPAHFTLADALARSGDATGAENHRAAAEQLDPSLKLMRPEGQKKRNLMGVQDWQR